MGTFREMNTRLILNYSKFGIFYNTFLIFLNLQKLSEYGISNLSIGDSNQAFKKQSGNSTEHFSSYMNSSSGTTPTITEQIP